MANRKANAPAQTVTMTVAEYEALKGNTVTETVKRPADLPEQGELIAPIAENVYYGTWSDSRNGKTKVYPGIYFRINGKWRFLGRSKVAMVVNHAKAIPGMVKALEL